MPRGKAKVDIIDLTNDDSEDSNYSPPKAKKKKNKESKPEVEKRTDEWGQVVRYSAKPSQKVRERIDRAMPGSGHRLFLIDRKTERPVSHPDAGMELFSVLGATGNVYQVKICKHPSCSCPDFAKGNICKHIIFVNLRVLKLDRNNPLIWQKALLSSEVNSMLAGGESTARLGADVMASNAVRRAYESLASGSTPAEDNHQGQRPIGPDSECPICQEELKANSNRAEEKVTFCFSCGNNLHKECIGQWIRSRRAASLEVTCPFCRSGWVDGLQPQQQQQQQQQGQDGYVNLANVSDAHRNADTSLQSLYGDRAIWVQANQGLISRRAAANYWNERV